ncbi:MAG: rod shape-determining protein MreC [Clostridiales bacterium]|nr:rod shape-determining protein MreC [Clostridiales bacterium]
MRKLFTSKWFIVTVAALFILVAIVLGALPGSPVNKLLKPVGAVASPIQRLVRNGGDVFSDFWAAITDGIAIRNENEQLRAEIADLQYQLTQNEEAGIRYEELREAFHIRDTFTNYDIFGASVLSREADEWFSVIRAGLGTEDGIVYEEGQSFAVVDVRMNLIGRVIDINESESNILPLLHEGFVVSGKVNAVNGANVTILGDAGLKRSGLCLVTDIAEGVILEPGTEIVTSGDGGLFPQGIPIGVIETVDYSNPIDVTATLRPYSDIGDLNDIFVMVPYSSNAERIVAAEESEAAATDVSSGSEQSNG